MPKTVDLDFLGRRSDQILDELRALRSEIGDVRDLTVLTSEYARRLDRRLAEMHDDVELVIKCEIGGRLAHVETTLELAIAKVAERVEALETH